MVWLERWEVGSFLGWGGLQRDRADIYCDIELTLLGVSPRSMMK